MPAPIIKPTLTLEAVVCCVHDVEKRQTVELAFDPANHKVHLCACCENLFLRRDDVPHYCNRCGGRPVHPVAGPIPDPIGEV